MTNVIELAKQCYLIDNSGACAFVEGTNLVPYIKHFSTLVRNASLEEAAQALRDVDALHAAGLVDATIDAIRNLKEPTP